MHDGQNLFDPKLSYGGVDWGVDEAMTRLIGEGRLRAAIVVGVWSTPGRLLEYMPGKAIVKDVLTMGVGDMKVQRKDVVSDAYLAFLVDELKPFIDRRYRTREGRDDTFVMGSSMGGLISPMRCDSPQVFGVPLACPRCPRASAWSRLPATHLPIHLLTISFRPRHRDPGRGLRPYHAAGFMPTLLPP